MTTVSRAETNPVAFEPVAEWVARYGAELRRHLERMLGSVDDAEDALQQVWMAAHRRPPDPSPDTNVRAWLYRVGTNAALDRLAGNQRRRAALEGRGPRLAPDPVATPDAGLLGLSERARGRIRERCARLPRKQREAVWLRWVEGEDYPVIARKLETTESGARANVYQGMKRLRKELFDLWKEEMAE